MIKYLTIGIYFLLLTKSSFCQELYVLDWSYQEMFEFASGKFTANGELVQLHSTAPYYVAIQVEDLNTGEIKDICTEYPFLEGAIQLENEDVVIDKEALNFSFKSKEALENIGFYSYSMEEFNECVEHVSVIDLLNQWSEDSDKFITKYSGKCQIYLAHKLFQLRIMTKRGSLMGELIIEDKESIKKLLKLREKY